MMPAGRTSALLSVALVALTASAGNSIGPSTMSREPINYETAIDDYWYGDFPPIAWSFPPASVMLLFSIGEVGVRTAPPVVTVRAN